MNLPKPKDIEQPLLDWLGDEKEHSLQEAIGFIEEHFKITPYDASLIMDSGKETHLQNRIRWAKVSLQQQDLVEKTRRGYFRKKVNGRAQKSDIVATELGLEEAKQESLQTMKKFLEEANELAGEDDGYVNQKLNRIIVRITGKLGALSSGELQRFQALLIEWQQGNIWFVLDGVVGYLRALIEEIEEYPDEFLLDADSTFLTSDLGTYWEICHPTVIKFAKDLFEIGKYAEAVEASIKELIVIVREFAKSKGTNTDDLSETSLMEIVFKSESPVISIIEGTDRTASSIRNGYQRLFAGSVLALRNPKTHSNISITSAQAMRELIFISSLMHILQDANVIKKTE